MPQLLSAIHRIKPLEMASCGNLVAAPQLLPSPVNLFENWDRISANGFTPHMRARFLGDDEGNILTAPLALVGFTLLTHVGFHDPVPPVA